MTKAEVLVLIKAMMDLYPNYKPTDLERTVNSWSAVLKYDEARTIQNALITYSRTDTSGFAPSVGQLVQLAAPDTSNDWMLVRQAICNSSYHAEEEFKALPERVQRLVGSPEQLREWARTDTDIVDTSIAKAFRERGKNVREDMSILRQGIQGQNGSGNTKVLLSEVRTELPSKDTD